MRVQEKNIPNIDSEINSAVFGQNSEKLKQARKTQTAHTQNETARKFTKPTGDLITTASDR